MGGDILPYIVFLVVPILGRMTDFSVKIRKVVTYCFATLVKLMPLEVPLLVLCCCASYLPVAQYKAKLPSADNRQLSPIHRTFPKK